MERIALGLAYDGTRWHGWQTQPQGTAVQDCLEAAVQSFLGGRRAATLCAGRTDSGVHALQQVVHMDVPVHRREESWVRGLNALLPDTVSVQWARTVAGDFHARFDACSRTYLYVLQCSRVRSPLMRHRVGWVHDTLCIDPMTKAAEILQGEHDFSAFRSSECQAHNPVRHLDVLDIYPHGHYLVFLFRANGFLHHMVRNLMGMLLTVGRGRQPVQWVNDVLSSRDRRLAAPTFMPDGLYLAHVQYPIKHRLPLMAPATALAEHLGISLGNMRAIPDAAH